MIKFASLLAVQAVIQAKQAHWSIKIFFGCISYFAPVKELFHVLTAAVLLNLITGYWKSKRIHHEPFSSKKARHSIEKMALYFGVFALTWMIEKEIIVYSDIYVTKVVSLIMILAESKSVTENADEITGTKLFTQVFKSIFGIFKRKYGQDLPEDQTNKPDNQQN